MVRDESLICIWIVIRVVFLLEAIGLLFSNLEDEVLLLVSSHDNGQLVT